MTTRSPSASAVTTTSHDYTNCLEVHAPLPQVIASLTDDAVISRWWTAATRSERRGHDVRLFMSNGALMAAFTIEHAPGTNEVTWAVTACIIADWIGTKPSFTIRPDDDGTCAIEFRHVGLQPALECFEQCRAGWDYFMPSLHRFLETGEGRPNEPREAAAQS